MKNIHLVIVLVSLFWLSFSSCCHGNSNGNVSKDDSIQIIRSYLVKIGLIGKDKEKSFDIDFFTHNRTRIPSVTFASIPMGTPIDLNIAQAEISNYIKYNIPTGAETTQLRSFYVDANLFRHYLGTVATEPTPHISNTDSIKFFKFIFASDGSSYETKLVITAFDTNGTYILLNPFKTGGQLRVYNQIAGCPSACPTVGQAQFDSLYIYDPGTNERQQGDPSIILQPSVNATPQKRP